MPFVIDQWASTIPGDYPAVMKDDLGCVVWVMIAFNVRQERSWGGFAFGGGDQHLVVSSQISSGPAVEIWGGDFSVNEGQIALGISPNDADLFFVGFADDFATGMEVAAAWAGHPSSMISTLAL